MYKFVGFSVFGVCLSVGMAFAAPQILDCKLTDLKQSGGWIPREALIKVDTQTKSVQLIKPTADQMNGKIVSSKLVRNNADKMILRWIVKGTKSKSNQATPAFNFRALFNKDTGKVSVIAKPLGYSNDFRAKGTCTLR